MPGSSELGKLTISNWYKKIGPKSSILDVGPGWGTYSKLLRHMHETWHAVEIYEPYVKRFKLHKYYDKIYVEDIRKFKPPIKYDLIILGDVLEHLRNREAVDVLKRLFKSTTWCIVSLPLDAETNAPSHNSSSYWENNHEEHLGKWSNMKFIKTVLSLGGEIIALEKYNGIAIYLICINSKNPFTSESPTTPFEWLLFNFSSWYQNKEENYITRYSNKIKRKLQKYL